MHGQEEQAGCGLTDVVYIKIFRHRARHRELDERRWKQGGKLCQLRSLAWTAETCYCQVIYLKANVGVC